MKREPDGRVRVNKGEVPVKKFYAYRAASALAAIVTLVVASGAGEKWF